LRNLIIFSSTEGYSFLSANYRLFKLPAEAKDCASMTATYLGGIQGSEDTFVLDYKFKFKVRIQFIQSVTTLFYARSPALQKDEPVTVPSDVTAILKFTRFSPFFKLEETTAPVKKVP
jgi:hypothetical protein